MRVRYQADADLNQVILLAAVRREPTLNFQSAAAAGLAGHRDPEVLAIAAAEGRVLVTHDHKTMPRHFADFITAGTSPGVLVIPQHLSLSAAADDLILIWTATEAEEWINRILLPAAVKGRRARHKRPPVRGHVGVARRETHVRGWTPRTWHPALSLDVLGVG